MYNSLTGLLFPTETHDFHQAPCGHNYPTDQSCKICADFPSWALHYGPLWCYFAQGVDYDPDRSMPFLPSRYLARIKSTAQVGELIFMGDYWTVLTPDRRWIYCEYMDPTCFVVPYSVVMPLGLQFFEQYFANMRVPALLELDPYMGEYYSITGHELFPLPTEDHEDDFIPEDQVEDLDREGHDQLQGDEQDFDDPDLAREWFEHRDAHNDGKMLFKDDRQTAVIIYTPEKQWADFDPDNLLPRYYVKKRGFRYYRRIAGDFDIPIRVMITPKEYINLATMQITNVIQELPLEPETDDHEDHVDHEDRDDHEEKGQEDP